MNTMTSRRPPRIAAAMAVLALSAGLSSACSPLPTAPTAPAEPAVQAAALPAGHDHGSGNAKFVPAAQAALRQSMRTLWAQHMEWTRLAIVDFAAGSGGFPSTAERLLRNQADIGDAIKPYYGEAAGAQLTTLLQTHITSFVALFQAAKVQDAAALKTATAAVYANAQEIADFLAAGNPANWQRQSMRSMMKGHIDQTIAYGSDELNGRYAEGIAAYDQAEEHMLMMADDLSAGLIKAFPGRFR